jgi:hypothetical protein
MMRQPRFSFHPRLEALEDRQCPSAATVTLPISAFLSQQGTTSLFTPPVPDQLAAANSIYDPGATSTDPNRFMVVDYTGQAASYLLSHGINLHTEVWGFVSETPAANGLVEVSVNLEATNALTWVANIANIDPTQAYPYDTAPLELGYRAQDLVANPTLKPALSDVHLQFNFQEQAGAPLPDLVAALNLGMAPAGFAPEALSFQTWGTGTLDAGTTEGTPGQTAFVNTSQIVDLAHALPGALPDGFMHEPINIVPVSSKPSSIAYLNGNLFITDLSRASDYIKITPAAGDSVTVYSNLGRGTFAAVSEIYVSLGGGNNYVDIASLPGVKVNVAALEGDNNINIGDASETFLSLGGGNNFITTGNTNLDWISVSGDGYNRIQAGTGQNNIYVAGNGYNHIEAAGAGDYIEVVGNGDKIIKDTGTNDLVTVGGQGDTDVKNDGPGSVTVFLGM